ncbi:hypothetical protein [Amycolatopsis anabasis]|uniref:hypothetical protein n=1 Tax=Amycolatopsis anabasis TaxID=1840409 RepID=UPI00131C2B8A|nr:hypothetical protein [Amycolatopsis anabasis]
MPRPLPSPIDQALAAAVRAPSPHNTQPWLFEVDSDRIGVLLDHQRVLAVADPDAKQARLACAAAAFNLRIALRMNGKLAVVNLLPDTTRPDLLAAVQLGVDQGPTMVERKLGNAIFQRRTNRRPFLEREVPPIARTPLVNAALMDDVRLEFVGASTRYDELTSLVRRAEQVQEADTRYAGELERFDGDARSLRDYHRTEHLPDRPGARHPLLAALITRDRGPRYELRAGLAMQRVLLTATYIGLSVSFVSRPFEVATTRAGLDDLFRRDGEIHALLRIGYGYPSPMTARRPVGEVTRNGNPVRFGVG